MEAQIESPAPISPAPIETIPEVGDYLYTPIREKFITRSCHLFVIYQLKEKKEDYWRLLNLMTGKKQLERTYDGKCSVIVTGRYKVVSQLEAGKILIQTMKRLNDRELRQHRKALSERVHEGLILDILQKQLDQGVIPENLL